MCTFWKNGNLYFEWLGTFESHGEFFSFKYNFNNNGILNNNQLVCERTVNNLLNELSGTNKNI